MYGWMVTRSSAAIEILWLTRVERSRPRRRCLTSAKIPSREGTTPREALRDDVDNPSMTVRRSERRPRPPIRLDLLLNQRRVNFNHVSRINSHLNVRKI